MQRDEWVEISNGSQTKRVDTPEQDPKEALGPPGATGGAGRAKGIHVISARVAEQRGGGRRGAGRQPGGM